jgi:predicted alpha/beta-hydrolase family hydrolase
MKKPQYACNFSVHVPRLCPNGGIGRRARFRTWFSQGSGGSSPLSGTKFSGNKFISVKFSTKFNSIEFKCKQSGAMNAVRELQFSVLDKDEVSALLLLPPKASCLLVMAHGAGAGMNHSFMTAMANELAAVGIGTLRHQFPYMELQRGVPDPQPVLLATVAAAVKLATKLAPNLPLFAGGKSMGGRMTSLAAAEQPSRSALEGLSGLVFLGFPLHPPKRPGIKRAEHLKRVEQPMLFLQGTRDELADLTLLRPICQELGSQTTLYIVEGADHSFHVLKRSGKTDAEVLGELARTVEAWTADQSAPATAKKSARPANP